MKFKRVVSGYYGSYYPFETLAVQGKTTQDPDDLRQGDVLLIWGGADISPDLYNKGRSRRSGADPFGPSRRDRIEWNLMNRARDLGVPIIGICRGAQMLCALAGGYLIQDITHHAGPNHTITHVNGQEYVVNSLHHQMMMPGDSKHQLLAWSTNTLSQHYLDVDEEVQVEKEPELVFFPEVRGLGAQWHPEMMRSTTPATLMLLDTIEELL